MINIFQKQDPYKQRLAHASPPVSSKQEHDLAKIALRLFASEDGQKFLTYLQVSTFQRALSPDASDAQIRYMEGQRSIIANILRLMDKGRH